MSDMVSLPQHQALWRDRGFGVGLRIALWGVLPAYLLGGFVFSWIYGPEAWLGWVFLFWEDLFWIEWTWLGPVALAIWLTGRPRLALGIIAGGAIVAVVQLAVRTAVHLAGVS
jgi:hypothetical protein